MKSVRGFTFIELLIIMAIIGVFAGFFLLTFPSGQRKARDTQRRSDLKQYQTSLERYANNNNSLYPTTSGLMINLCPTLQLSVCPDDPQGNSYQYVALPSGLGYYIWGELEQPNQDGDTEFFVVCSNGVTGTLITTPSGVSCPL